MLEQECGMRSSLGMIWQSGVVLFFMFIINSQGQFHQNSYNIVHDRIEITDFNKSAVIDPMVSVFKYNETLVMKAINASAYFTPGVRKNILANFAVYKYVKSAYRTFPINVTLDLCDEYNKNPFGLQAAVKNSNFKGCPCPVGLYYLFNFVLQQDLFPPHIPVGKYKLDINIKIDDRIYLINAVWYGSVTPK